MKYKDLGKVLSNEEMKSIKGGIEWPEFRDFHCQMDNGDTVSLYSGGCSKNSGCAAAYCIATYPTYTFVGVYVYNVGCPYETAC